MRQASWPGRSRRREKAEIEKTVQSAVDGDLVVRARAVTAYRVRLRAPEAEEFEDLPPLAAAGAILEARAQHDVYRVYLALENLIKALN